MRIFLTGASGFIGSHLLPKIVESGHEVAVLLRPGSNREKIEKTLTQVNVVQGSLSRPMEWCAEMQNFAPETVIHLAWTGVLNTDRDDPSQTHNVHETAELVKMAHQFGARNWIGLGSQAEYGPCNKRISETQPTNPTTLYGISKLAACGLTRGLCAKLGMRFGWLRLFSSYGPGDNPAWMIPSLILKLKRGERPALTRCEQLWDYIYGGDAADAIIRVAESENAEGIFNLGSGQARPLREIVESIRNMVNPDASLGFGEVPYRADQVMHLEADITRLQQSTGWSPRTSIEDGLRETVRYYMAQNTKPD